MDTKESLIPKGKEYDPTLTPGPNVSYSIVGIETPSKFIYKQLFDRVTNTCCYSSE